MFNKFAGTKISCMTDFDYLYLNALTDSDRYLYNRNEITFRDDTGKITIVLTLIPAPQATPSTNPQTQPTPQSRSSSSSESASLNSARSPSSGPSLNGVGSAVSQ
jgi:hypothetical protein